MANYPASLDNGTSLPNPTGTSTQNNPDHAGLHSSENAAIIAVETKLGTGASTPIANTILFGTGTGTSAWTALTSAQLAATLSDETGSGSAVFATTPTLVTPKVDTINESTLNNGVTVGGVNLKAGALNTSNSIVTSNLTDNSVTASKLATNAVTLSTVTSSTSQGSIGASDVILTGLTTTVTVPSGGRKIRIEVLLPIVASSAIATPKLTIYNSATITGSPVQTVKGLIGVATAGTGMYAFFEHTPAAGSQSYCAGISVDAGTGSTTLSATQLAILTVKVV